MDNHASKIDLPKWSLDEKNKLLTTIQSMAGGSTKSYKAFETSINWNKIDMDGKSEEECKAMYQRLTHKVRKYRTMSEIITDAVAVVTDDPGYQHPDLPKKPPTAFSLFVMKRSKKFPDLKGNNRMKLFAADWNELPEERKDFYKRKYLKLKLKYEADLDIFRQNNPECPVPGSSAPQPPLPCKLFVESRLEKVKSKEPELSHADAVKKLTIKYKKLSDRRKLKWINKANNCLPTYLDQCEVYMTHNPKSTLKPAVLHLNKQEQRIWNSSRGKPVTVPAKNVFMYFCNARRDSVLHLNFSEQSRQLSSIYHELSKDELKELTDKFIQDVEEYVRSYTEYYQSLSQEERVKEKSLDEALAQYNKILENDKKNKLKKLKKESKENGTKSKPKKEIKKSRLSDILPRPQENYAGDDSNESTSSLEEASPVKIEVQDKVATQSKNKRKIELQDEVATPSKKMRKIELQGEVATTSKKMRKIELQDEVATTSKKMRKIELQDEVATTSKKKKKQHEDGSQSAKMVASSEDLLSMWSPLRTNAPPSEDQVTPTLPTSKSKSPKKAKRSKESS